MVLQFPGKSPSSSGQHHNAGQNKSETDYFPQRQRFIKKVHRTGRNQEECETHQKRITHAEIFPRDHVQPDDRRSNV